MPDLSVEYFYHCESAEHFSIKIKGSKEYTVTYGKSRGMYQYDYHCTCDAFKFGKGKPCKHCKHIEQAKTQHCNWQQFLEGGKPDEKNGEKCCPKCGAGVHSQGHGV